MDAWGKKEEAKRTIYEHFTLTFTHKVPRLDERRRILTAETIQRN